MDDKELLRQYQEQMTGHMSQVDNSTPPDLGDLYTSSYESGDNEAQPESASQQNSKLKKILSDKKNRLLIIVGGFTFFLLLLALLAPTIAPLFQPKEPEATPIPTYIPIAGDDTPKSFTFDTDLNSDFAKLKKDSEELEIVDLELSFPRTEWEVEF